MMQRHSRRRRDALPLILATMLFAPSLAIVAGAQSPYVGAALVGNVVRESSLGDSDGETLGWSLRVGTAIGERWGIDAEFVRAEPVEWNGSIGILSGLGGAPSGLAEQIEGLTGPYINISSGISAAERARLTVPYTSSASTRHSTLSTMLWVRQSAGDRLDIVYLGGVAFARFERRSNARFLDTLLPGIFPPPSAYESVSYDTGPAVGMDARVRMTDHLRLVPGMRLLVIGGTWIARPSVGVHWAF